MKVRWPLLFLLGSWLIFTLQIPALCFAEQHDLSKKTLGLLPVPLHIELQGESLRIDRNFSVSGQGYWEPRLTRAANRLLERLSRQTGLIWAELPSGPSEQAVLLLIIL